MNNNALWPHQSGGRCCRNMTCIYCGARTWCAATMSFTLSICSNPHVALSLLTVAVDGSLRVDWSAASSLSDLALLGSTRTCLARRLILTAPLGALDFSEVPLTIFFLNFVIIFIIIIISIISAGSGFVI